MEIWDLSYFSEEADVMYSLDDEIYRLNRYMLRISPILRNLLDEKLGENDEIREIKILTKPQWDIFLRYIYYDYCVYLDNKYKIGLLKQFNIISKQKYKIDNLDDIQLINLYYACDILDVNTVKDTLEIKLLNILNNYLDIQDYEIVYEMERVLPDHLIEDLVYGLYDTNNHHKLVNFCKIYNKTYICKLAHKIKH